MSVQSHVSRGMGIVSTRVVPPSQSESVAMLGDPAVELGVLREVVGYQPHRAADLRVTRRDDHGPARHAPKLAHALLLALVPMMDGEDRVAIPARDLVIVHLRAVEEDERGSFFDDVNEIVLG